jgi:hypothetical protein
VRRDKRYKKRDSERSGFTYLERQLVKDEGVLVGPDEFDSPPPSEEPLGGEGDISHGNTRADYTSIVDSQNLIRVVYVTSATTIPYEQKVYTSGESINNGYFYIVGSLGNVELATNPQISTGKQSDKLTIECVGSSVTLVNGSGLNLRGVAVMDSGFIMNLIYNQTDSLWYETSRSHRTRVV